MRITRASRAALIEQLKRHEGFRSLVYRCTANKLTVGYGRNLEDNGITQKEAEQLLLNDINRIEASLMVNIVHFGSLPAVVQNVLINMAFQMGVEGLIKFKKTLFCISKQKYKEASIEMLNSRWAQQTPNRAKELSDLIANLE